MKIEYKMQINNFFKHVKIGQIGTEHQIDQSIMYKDNPRDNNKTYLQKHQRTKTKLKRCRC